MNVVYSKILNINLAVFFRECHLKLSMPIVLTILIGYSLQIYFPIAGWFGFLVKVLTITLIYLVLMWKIGMNSTEKTLIWGILTRIKWRLVKR